MENLEIGELILVRDHYDNRLHIAKVTGLTPQKVRVEYDNDGRITNRLIEIYSALEWVKDMKEFEKHLSIFNSMVK